MRAALVIVPTLGLALLAGACNNRSTVSSDARDAGRQMDNAVSGVSHSPQVRQAQADLRQAGHDVSRDLHKAADEARTAFHRLANEAHHSVRQASGHGRPYDRNG